MLGFRVSIIEIVDWWAGVLGSHDYRFEIALLSNGKYCTYLTCAGEVTVSEECETESAARSVCHGMLDSVGNELGVV